jgi:hypothetical protein
MESDRLTRAIALYGALVSSLSVAWAIVRDRRDRGLLRVRVAVALSKFYEHPTPVMDEMLWEVVNAGKRAAYVKDVGGLTIDGQSFWMPVLIESGGNTPAFPGKLEPGEHLTFRTLLIRNPLLQVKRLGVKDTLHNWWYAPASDFIEVYRRHLQFHGDPVSVPLSTRIRSHLPAWFRG